MGSDAKKNYGAVRTDALRFDPDKLVIVGLDDDGKDEAGEVHNLYDDSVHLPVREEDVADVMQLGVHTPVKVHREMFKGHWRVVIAAGRQRVKWAREANKRLRKARKPPILVTGTWEKDDPMGVMISENVHRRAADSAKERALKLKRYMGQGHSIEEAATVGGCTTATVKNLIAFLEADPSIHRAVEKGLPLAAGYKLSKLPKEDQKAQVTEIMASVADSPVPAPSGGGGSSKSKSKSKSAPSKSSSKPPAPPKGRELARRIDEARGKTLPSQRVRLVKELKAMRARAEAASLPNSALAVFDWALGDDKALDDYIPPEESEATAKAG